jgi:hypothetical protein
MFKRTIQPIGPARSGSCILINLLATPGLGSLMAGRWVAGSGQLALAVAGFLMVMVWFFEVMVQYYSQIVGGTPSHPVGWIGITGGILFIISWIWALVTSISLFFEARRNAAAEVLKGNSPGESVPPKL